MDGDRHELGLERRITRLESRVRELELLLELPSDAATSTPPQPAAPPGPPPAPALWRYEPHREPGPALPPTRPGGLWGVTPAPARALPVPTATPAAGSSAALARSAPAPSPVRSPMPVDPTVVPGWAQRQTNAPAKPAINLRDLEERFAGRALAWIGGFALVAAAVFFMSLAFSRGWVTEPMRVVIGLVGGAGVLSLGALSFDRRNPLLGNVLTAVGLGVVSISLFAATRQYALVSPEFGLAGALVAAIAAAVVAVRYDAREVAAFGLVAALIAPPVMGASPTTLTLLFVAVTLIGTTAIALFRSWRWLPSIAFVLAAPQLASWLAGGADTAQALVALTGFWLVNVIAAGGEEVRIRRDDLRPSSATLVLANAAFLTWGGYAVLDGGLHVWMGTFVALAALAHLAIGAAFLRRQGLEHLFGNLVAGTGIALLALAAFEQFGAALVPVAWAAEGAALAWLAARRRHVWSALSAALLGAMAVAHLVLVEYPLTEFVRGPVATSAWQHPAAAALGAVIAAIAVAGWFAHVGWIRSLLVAVASALVGYAAVFEVAGPSLATTWVVVGVAAMLVDVAVMRAGTRADLEGLGAMVRVGLGTCAAGALGLLALGHIVTIDYPIAQATLRAAPFSDAPWPHFALVPVVALLAAAVVVGWAWPSRLVRTAFAAAGALLIGYVLTFETAGALLIALLWVVGFAVAELDPLIARLQTRKDLAFLDRWEPGAWLGTAAGAWLGFTAIAALIGVEYAPGRLTGPVPAAPYAGEPALALAIVLVGLALLAARVGTRGIRSAMAGIGILLIAWSVPFELDGTARVALLAVLLPVAVVGDRLIARLPDAKRLAFLPLPAMAGGLASGAGGVAWLGALLVAVAGPLRPTGWGTVTPPAIPFTDETALVAVILAGAAIAAAAWAVTVEARQAALLGSIVPIAVVVPLEVFADFVVVGWLLLTGVALAISRPSDRLRTASLGLAGVLAAGAVVVAFAIVATPDRLVVVDPAIRTRAPLLAGWWIALATVAAVPYLASRRPRLAAWRPVLEVLAAAVGVYLVSVGVVDVFTRMLGGAISAEELAKQAQVAMSVAWTGLGALALGFGLFARRAMPRHVGFGLLALATAKVFVLDLAAMDVAYRAVVLAGLGALLLASAWLVTHLRGPRAGTPGPQGPRPAG